MMQFGSRVASMLLAAVVALALSASAVVAQTTFTVTAFDSTDYLINELHDPMLTLTRGQTYTFNVDASGHPFWIKTVRSTGSVNAFNNGVTNNGDDVGTVTFAVPLDAPNPLAYSCGVHALMGGTINIVDASAPTPTPTRTATTSPSPTATATTGLSPTPTGTPGVACTGDCNGDSSVTVDDVVVLANIAGGAEPQECPHGIPGGSTVDEAFIITALTTALGQCSTGG